LSEQSHTFLHKRTQSHTFLHIPAHLCTFVHIFVCACGRETNTMAVVSPLALACRKCAQMCRNVLRLSSLSAFVKKWLAFGDLTAKIKKHGTWNQNSRILEFSTHFSTHHHHHTPHARAISQRQTPLSLSSFLFFLACRPMCWFV
jgi:hypothetical protein